MFFQRVAMSALSLSSRRMTRRLRRMGRNVRLKPVKSFVCVVAGLLGLLSICRATLLVTDPPQVSVSENVPFSEPVQAVVLSADEHGTSTVCVSVPSRVAGCLCDYDIVIGSLGAATERFPVRLNCVDRSDHPPATPLPILGNDGITPTVARLSEKYTLLVPSPVSPASAVTSEEPRRFWLHVTEGSPADPAQSAPIDTVCVQTGDRLRVVADVQLPITPRLQRLAAEIVELGESQVLPELTQLIGPWRDIDGDERLTIVLTPWLGQLQGGRVSVSGLVRGHDYRTDLPARVSNHSDVIFLNSSLTSASGLEPILAHELAHALCFCVRNPSDAGEQGFPVEADWINEGLAYVAEHRATGRWANVRHRLQAFVESPTESPLVVSDLQAAGLWRCDGCRGATFLFWQWCLDEFGPNVARRVVYNRAVGPANVEQATGRPFPWLFRRFCVSLADLVDVMERRESQANSARPSAFLERFGPQLAGTNSTQTLRRDWNGREDCRFELNGTTCQIIRMPADSRRCANVLIEAPTAANLQVTLVRRPHPE